MKKLLAFLSAFTLVVSSCAFSVSADQAGDALTGDVNNDGAVTSADLVMLSEFLLGADYNIARPDINNDGNANILDLIILKKLLIGETSANEYNGKELQPDKTETTCLFVDLKEHDDNSLLDSIDEQIGKTAIYVDSYDKINDLIRKLSEQKLIIDDFHEKYNKEFFTDHSVVFYFTSTSNQCVDLESITAEDGKLILNVFEHEETPRKYQIRYVASEFTKDVLSSDNITDAEFRPTQTYEYKCQTGLPYLYYKFTSGEYISLYKWINSSVQLDDLLTNGPVTGVVSDDEKDRITSEYNSEFFNTNKLLVYHGYEYYPEAKITYDEKVIEVTILSHDMEMYDKIFFIAIPLEVAGDKETFVDRCRK